LVLERRRTRWSALPAGQPHHVQPNDELFPVDGQIALFDLPSVEEKLPLG
jgi:hypothetical protein